MGGAVMKRTIAFLLIFAMLLSLAACSDAGTEEKNANASADAAGSAAEAETEPETEKPFLDNLPDDLDWNGAEIRFLSAIESKSIALQEEDEVGELVADAYWKRNEALSGRLNITIAEPVVTGFDNFNAAAKQSVTAGSDDYDIFCGHTRFNISLAANHNLLNLKDAEYLDLSQKYWSTLYTQNVNYKDNLFWLAGDMTHSFISYLYAMFVNSSLWNDLYTGENIYDIVLEGNWNLDTLAHYAESCYIDLNGNGAKDDNDSYGVIMQQGHVLNGMFFAAGTQYTSIDEAGNYTIILNNEHTVDVFNKLHTLFYSTDYGRMLENSAFDGTCVEMFVSDRLLFCPNTFAFAENEKVRDMESDFFIVPLPKYDEKQEDYRVNQYDGVPIYGIPVTSPVDHFDMVTSVLEAMCSMTSKSVIPVYYDMALKNKYSRDQTTAIMIDLVHDSITADFSFCWGDTIGGIMSVFYENIPNESIESKLKAQEKAWNKQMNKLLDKLSAES